MLQALIFDVDGTLAETEELHRRSFNGAFAASGLDWVWDQGLYADLLQVAGGKERIAHFIAAHGARPVLGPAEVARLHADKTERYTALVAAGAAALRPGVLRLLTEARAARLRLAIATTTSPPNVDALLRAALGPGGPAWFDVIAAGDCVPAKKPAPDIYRLALERLSLPPGACIAFEDTQNGLLAATAAGIPTIVTLSLYGGDTGFDAALAVVGHLGDPSQPARSQQGPPLARALVDLAQLHAWRGGVPR